MHDSTPLAAAILAALGFASAARAQSFIDSASHLPQGAPFNNSFTENVDLADVDQDGDFDAVWADGGDFGNDQNRLWINLGGAQGGTLGFFQDETAARLPAVLDDSRDVDFADFDGDGDADLLIANTSAIANQTSRLWVNMGGAQGGTAGFFQEETALRWLNIAVNNGTTSFSSVAPTLKLVNGGFIDWSCDGAFGDLDNDGDLDLVQSSYGGIPGGDVPTRVFLNDGSGHYEEFNPSHYQLAGSTIPNGVPGIWCEGIHQQGANNTTGQFCDIADTPVGVDLGDLDGDLDIDVITSARTELPRVRINRSVELGGTLSLRDVSFAVLPPNWAPGSGHYEQELGDLDNDGDLDLYGTNWDNVCDSMLTNDGSGAYTSVVQLPQSCARDNEGDFVDYDNDGDLDLWVDRDSGQEKLYANPGAGGAWTLSITSGQIPVDTTLSIGSDAWDVDQDGDYDVFVANDVGAANVLNENITQVPDVTAPSVLRLEQAPNRIAGPAPTTVRVQVYDNAAWYLTATNSVRLEYRVNGGVFSSLTMQWSGGQVFRAEIAGFLVGQIDYRVRSFDAYGNMGLSPMLGFTASSSGCGSATTYCTAKLNSLGCIPSIAGTGTPSATAGSGFVVTGSNVRNNKTGLLFYGVSGPSSIPLQGGTLCVQSPIKRTPVVVSGGSPAGNDCTGVYSIDMNAFAVGSLGGTPLPALGIAGTQVHCQWWGRDPGFPAPLNTTLSDGLRYELCP